MKDRSYIDPYEEDGLEDGGMEDQNYVNPYEVYDDDVAHGRIPSVPIPEIEREKYYLTVEAQRAVKQGDYGEAARIFREIAKICHRQGKEHDAYLNEHEAFRMDQLLIYRKAKIPLTAFAKTPYAEKLKEALDDGAGWADAMGQTDYSAAFRMLSARICRAQGQERDAYLLEDASYKILEAAGRRFDWKKVPTQDMEAECLRKIARRYGSKLWEDGEVGGPGQTTGTGGGHQASIESRKKDFNAVMDMLKSEELSESMRRIFVNAAHEPVEQLIYDLVINGGGDGRAETLETIVEKGAKLYFLHSLLNVKWGRSEHYKRNSYDGYLLGCIVGEIKKRRPAFQEESEKTLKRLIYRKFKRTSYDLNDIRFPIRDEQFTNFDDYVKFLWTEERNGVMEIESFTHLWSLVGLRRDNTFEKVRPTQDELYIFCFALALDYDVYCRLRDFEMKEMAAEKARRASGAGPEEGTPRFREKFFARGFTNSGRDEVMRHYLVNVDTRLECAVSDLKSGEDFAKADRIFIPGMMVGNVNTDLLRIQKELEDPAYYPLTVKADGGGRRLAQPEK